MFLKEESTLCRAYTNVLNVFGMKQLINVQNRITDTTCTILDLIVTNSSQTLVKSSCIDYYFRLIFVHTYITSKRIELESPCCQVLKPFEFSSKAEQLGLSSSIRLVVMFFCNDFKINVIAKQIFSVFDFILRYLPNE